MSEKRFNCVLGKDYHIINNNVDNMTYFLQDGNDVVLVINLMNRLVEENEQLKQSNDRFADTVAKQVSLLIELRKENEKLRQIIKDIVCATDETYTKNTSMFKVTVVFDGKMYNQIRRCLNE